MQRIDVSPIDHPSSREFVPIGAVSQGKASLRAFCVVVLIAFALFALFTGVTYFPRSPLSPGLPASVQSSFRELLPEGWAFFTRSQRNEDQFAIYRRSGDGWKNVFAGPQGEPRNLFGILRTPRAEGVEMGLITNAPGSHFSECKTQWTACARDVKLIAQPITNPVPHPLLCGDLLFVMQKPVPWSWARFKHVTMPSRIAFVNVSCK